MASTPATACMRIVENFDDRAGFARNFLRGGDDLLDSDRSRREWRCGFSIRGSRREQQRMRHIVSVAYIGESDLFQIAESFLQGEIVRQRLARMFEIT